MGDAQAMNALVPGQRVRLTGIEPKGASGTVNRVAGSGRAAWVRMDEPLPDQLRTFEPEDERARDRMVYVDEVELIG